MGLYVKKIVELHGGNIKLISKIGEGTTFISVPLSNTFIKNLPMNVEQKKILIVEDDFNLEIFSKTIDSQRLFCRFSQKWN